MNRIWDLFPLVADAVQQRQLEAGLVSHHDFYHALRVGEVARQVASDEWGNERLSRWAGLAGLCHNADHVLRLLMQTHVGMKLYQPTAGEIANLVRSWLKDAGLSHDEQLVVTDAVANHGNKNNPEDHRVLIALMDADRVVNLDLDLVIRSGQFYHDLPPVDHRLFLSDPDATYREPRTALRDIAFSLDWVNPDSAVCVRTRLGKEFAKPRATILRRYLDDLQRQLEAEGFPFLL